MSFCNKCGNEVIEGSTFCSRCGNSLSDTQSILHGSSPGLQIDDEDFAVYIGKNADKYLSKFKRFNIEGIDNFAATWNWSAFLVGPLWMLYRKLYLYFIIFFVITCIPYFGILTWIAAGIIANYLYYKQAKSKILEVKSSHSDIVISEALARIGGVNSWVWPVGIIIFIIVFISGIITGLFS